MSAVTRVHGEDIRAETARRRIAPYCCRDCQRRNARSLFRPTCCALVDGDGSCRQRPDASPVISLFDIRRAISRWRRRASPCTRFRTSRACRPCPADRHLDLRAKSRLRAALCDPWRGCGSARPEVLPAVTAKAKNVTIARIVCLPRAPYDSKNRFFGRGRPRFSRSVLPSYSRRNRPRRCNSGTTRVDEIVEPAGQVGELHGEAVGAFGRRAIPPSRRRWSWACRPSRGRNSRRAAGRAAAR